jgi:conjugal transfer mating pair stabilization protein TraN
MNSQSPFAIFSGEVKTCQKDFLNFANCCADSGWGLDVHLARCPSEAKELGNAKAHGLAVYIGRDRHCHFGFCRNYQRYCIFSSPLARAIQEQGRHQQLQIGFGNYRHPDCRGLTPEEFSHLHLDQMNLSAVYADMTQKISLENARHLPTRVTDKISALQEERKRDGE